MDTGSKDEILREFLFEPMTDDVKKDIKARLEKAGFPVESVVFTPAQPAQVTVNFMDGTKAIITDR